MALNSAVAGFYKRLVASYVALMVHILQVMPVMDACVH